MPRHQTHALFLVSSVLFTAFLNAPLSAEAPVKSTDPWFNRPPANPHSPVNQVFHWVASNTCTAWSDGSTNRSTAYLWVPERCARVRGLLILCANVPEHMLVGHPAIRAVCEKENLAIVWAPQSFMNWSKPKPGGKKMSSEWGTTVAFLQTLLDDLAKVSGYEEVATAPWLPMGESGHLLMVDALMEGATDRCIAGVFVKNNHLPPANRTIPTFVIYGSAQEWGQEKSDIRTNWNNIGRAYEGILGQCQKNPGWALSYMLDGHSGHFDCSEGLALSLARYIANVMPARLTPEGALRPIDLAKGYLADLPVPGHEGKPVRPWIEVPENERGLPWFFDKASALEAQAVAAINWKAETQFPVFVDENGKDLPHLFNGITGFDKPVMEADGVTFTIRGRMAPAIPEGFVGAGEPLSSVPGTPVVEWQSGPLEPLGNGRFRVSLDRAYPHAATYLTLRHPGDEKIRGVVQPLGMDIRKTRTTGGQAQKIAFAPVPDVPAGTKEITLVATTDAGLPVSFFVVAGPAVVKENRLVFTAIPPRAKMPLEVTVAAWQWGRSSEPKVNTAEIVYQKFRLTAK